MLSPKTENIDNGREENKGDTVETFQRAELFSDPANVSDGDCSEDYETFVEEKAKHLQSTENHFVLSFLRQEELAVLQALAKVRSCCGNIIPETVAEILIAIHSSAIRFLDGLEEFILELVDPEGVFKKTNAKKCQQVDHIFIHKRGPSLYKRLPRFDAELTRFLLERIGKMEVIVRALENCCAKRFPAMVSNRMQVIDSYTRLQMSLGELCLVIVESILASTGIPVKREHLDSTWVFLSYPFEHRSALD